MSGGGRWSTAWPLRALPSWQDRASGNGSRAGNSGSTFTAPRRARPYRGRAINVPDRAFRRRLADQKTIRLPCDGLVQRSIGELVTA